MKDKNVKARPKERQSQLEKTKAAWHALYKTEASDPEKVIARRITSVSTNTDAFSRSRGKSTADKIKLCRSAYYNVGIIGNVIDIMTDFALEGLTIVHNSMPVERLFNKWAQTVGLHEVVEEILRNLFRDGNVPIVHYDATIGEESIGQMKRIVASRTTAQERRDLFYTDDIADSVIPYKFSVLDVLRVKSDDFDIFGRPNFYYEFDSNEVQATLRKKDFETQELLSQLKGKMTSDGWLKFTKTGLYELSNLSMIYYKKDSFSAWAVPMLWRIIDDIKFKTTLRNMDISIAESIQNAVQIFRLGDTKNGLPPSPEQFERLTSMLRNPSKSKQIVWDDLISIESDYPDTGKILGSDKYTEVNANILAGLGISEVLIGGPGGNYSNSFLSCRTLLERLETARTKVLFWINQQLQRITKALKLRRPPIVKFANMSLRDENAEKRMLLELVDRNVISYRTLLDRFGEDLDIETKRMSREDALRAKLRQNNPHALKKVGKFGPQDQGDATFLEREYDNAELDNIETKKETPSQQGPEGEKGGRPPTDKDEDGGGATDEQETKRDTKPKGMGQLDITRAYTTFVKIKELISQQVCEARDVPFESLSDAEMDDIGDMTLTMLCRIGVDEDITPDLITDNMFKAIAPKKLDRCVAQVYKKLVTKYRQRTGKAPSKKQQDKLRSSAWAICRSQLKV